MSNFAKTLSDNFKLFGGSDFAVLYNECEVGNVEITPSGRLVLDVYVEDCWESFVVNENQFCDITFRNVYTDKTVKTFELGEVVDQLHEEYVQAQMEQDYYDREYCHYPSDEMDTPLNLHLAMQRYELGG